MIAVAVGCAAAAAPGALAHHSVLPFDGTRGTEVSGVVTRLRWRHPHTLIELDVPRSAGRRERWVVESESPAMLERLGWAPQAIAVGDWVTVLGARAKDGSTALRCKRITLADGRSLECFR